MRKFRLLSGLGVLACAGAALAFTLAGPVGADTGTTTDPTTTTTTTTGHGKHGHRGEKSAKVEQGDEHQQGENQTNNPRKGCRKVVLWGSDGSGAVTLTVTKASGRSNSALVGTQATLTVPAGSTLHAIACTDANSALALKQLVVKVVAPTPSAKPSGD